MPFNGIRTIAPKQIGPCLGFGLVLGLVLSLGQFSSGAIVLEPLLTILEKWKKCVDKGKVFGALLTDLSKALDFADHEILTAKLNAKDFNL